MLQGAKASTSRHAHWKRVGVHLPASRQVKDGLSISVGAPCYLGWRLCFGRTSSLALTQSDLGVADWLCFVTILLQFVQEALYLGLRQKHMLALCLEVLPCMGRTAMK